MKLSLAVALFRAAVLIISIIQQTRWYQQGKAAAYAEMDAEQRKRVAEAEAARADADALNANGGLYDDDGFQRPD